MPQFKYKFYGYISIRSALYNYSSLLQCWAFFKVESEVTVAAIPISASLVAFDTKVLAYLSLRSRLK